MKNNANSTLRLPALEIRQGPRRTLYTFAVDGKELANFATISRIGRTDEHAITGYQRPEVLSHIAGCSIEVERAPEYAAARADAGQLLARAVQGPRLEWR